MAAQIALYTMKTQQLMNRVLIQSMFGFISYSGSITSELVGLRYVLFGELISFESMIVGVDLDVKQIYTRHHMGVYRLRHFNRSPRWLNILQQ